MTPDQTEENAYLRFHNTNTQTVPLHLQQLLRLLFMMITPPPACMWPAVRTWLRAQQLTKPGAETTATESFAISAGETFIPAHQSTVVVTQAWPVELVAL